MNSLYKFLLKHRFRLLALSVFTAVFLIAVYPLFQDGLVFQPKIRDLDYHLLRIEGLKNELLLGNFPVYIHSLALYGYGYANSLFYPEVFLYIPAVLGILGLGITESYKIFVALITVFAILSSYLSSKYITKSRYAALCFTVLFVLSQYRLSNVFLRAAVGEYCACLFIPIVAAGIYDLLYNNYKKPYILGLGFLGLILTHSISFAIAGIITLVFLLFHIKYLFKNLYILIRLFYTGLAVALLTCFSWLPMIEQLISDDFGINKPWAVLSKTAIPFQTLFDFTYFAAMGLPLFVFIMIRMFISKQSENTRKYFRLSDKFLITGIILAFMGTRLFPWTLLDGTVFNYIQFPWRLFAFASMFLSLAVAINMGILLKEKQRIIALISVFIIMSVFAVVFLNPMIESKIHVEDDHYANYKNTGTIGAAEWIPLGTKKALLKDPYNALTENGEKILMQKNGSTVSFYNTSYADDFYFDIPLLYYKGYSAFITTEANKSYNLKIEKSPNNNLIRVYNPTNVSGEITVTYSGTSLQKISFYTSVFSLFLLLCCFVLYRKVRKKAP